MKRVKKSPKRSKASVSPTKRTLYNQQNGKCKWCDGTIYFGQIIEIDHTLPKVCGSTSAGALFGKGASDAVVAYACDDGVCFLVSCVGCGFDTLQFLASFIPGPNVTVIVTLPGSVACKTFVWACKNQVLPWKGGCK